MGKFSTTQADYSSEKQEESKNYAVRSPNQENLDENGFIYLETKSYPEKKIINEPGFSELEKDEEG